MKKAVKRGLIALLIIAALVLAVIVTPNVYLIATTPAEYIIKTENYFDYQPNFECSGYSSAYVLRSLGEEADGMTVYGQIGGKNSNGTVPPEALVNYLNDKGYNAKLCTGTLFQLKNAVSAGTPVITFVRVSPTSSEYHYLPIVGYDEELVFAAESLNYMKNSDEQYYNRSITSADFETMWDTELPQKNLYITISK